MKKKFTGDKKEGTFFLKNFEKKLVEKVVPKVPKWIGTHHLTYTTILWSALIILFSYFAQWDINWLWWVSLVIFCQWFTDLLDGAVGRYRKTGLIKWGYYMDHFLDYVFLCSIMIGYSFIVPQKYIYLSFFIFAVFVAFMINSFLEFSVTNKFRVSYYNIGPTEVRMVFVTVNALICIFGKVYIEKVLPYVLIGSVIGLFFVVYKIQKNLWKLDMKNKGDKK